MNRITLVAHVQPHLQLAWQQARRPWIDRVEVSNRGEQAVAGARLVVRCDPVVAEPLELGLPTLEPGRSVTVGADALPLVASTERLLAQQEREEGHLRLSVVADGAELAVQIVPIAVLPAHHWDGLGAGPELLAAFVRPNTTGTAQWLERARDVLQRRRLDPSFEGYQSRTRERVLEIASAIYAVPTAAGITYANAPAGFERSGQRIRMPDQVFADGMGNCLDLTNAMAAALEQAGLHPLLVVQNDHAFAGVWLGPDHPADSVLHDPAELRKRTDLGQCVVFDSSPACRGLAFEQAVQRGRALLDDEAAFCCAIDVRACRQIGVRPLPSRVEEAVEPTVRRGDVREAASVAAGTPALPPLPSRVLETLTGESRTSRLDRWRGNLLDLTTRNRLLDLRDGKQVIPLLADDAAAVEDAVYARASLVLRPRPATDATTPAELRRHATEAAASGELRADLTETALSERALELYRRATAAERDSGHSPLFLTIGLMRWYESATSDVARHAPLLLVPIQLVRDSVRGPYRIRRRDEDAELNPTLLRKLHGEFGIPVHGLEPVLEESGVDVALTLQNVRQAILGQPRFDVLPVAHLAMLSFERVLLYNDLQANLAALQSNPVVSRLLDPSAPALPQPAPMAGARDSDRRPAREDFCIVDADSSQQAAVWSAVDGNSFVLQGPPGTGKSQTITNLVAQLLARGKTVLFVAEKRAALEVVHSRLKGAGLGPFVLDAHSDSDDVRVSVIHQLDEPARYAWQAPDGGWAQHASALERTREELNAHVRRIHTPGPFGESLYEASGKVLALHGAPRVELATPEAPTREQVEALEAAAARTSASAAVVAPLSAHPLRVWDPPGWTPQIERDVATTIAMGRERLRELANALAAAAPSLGVAPDTRAWSPWVDAVRAAAGPPLSLPLLGAPQPDVDALLGQVIPLLEQRAAAATVAEQALLPTVYAEPALVGIQSRLARWATAFFLIAWIALFGTRRRLRAFAKSLPLPRNVELRTSVDAAALVQRLDTSLASSAEAMRSVFGSAWRGPSTSVHELRERAERRRQIRTALAQAEATPQQRDALFSIAVEADVRLAADTPEGARLRRLLQAADAWEQARATLYALLVPRVTSPLGNGIAEQETALESLAPALSRLRDWASWRADARSAAALGLGPCLAAAEKGELDPAQLLVTVQRAIRTQWIDALITSDPELSRFQGEQHDERIARFRQLEQQAQELARRHVQSLLAARLPDPAAPGPMEVIRREVRKKSRHIAVRRLFTELRDVVQLLKPCVLMSPLSVARYLDPSLPLYDVVVFDEASQIPPWDAVGALARARQAIVVGDSKQLPPTTFFRKDPGESSAEDDDVEDLESILDQCAVAGFREIGLAWHYRSRHESLIAFSNAAYYQNALNIFPSPLHDHPALGVKWVHVADGQYDRGASRTNRREADAVVAGVLAHVRDPGQRRRSLGVVTFATSQQELIENLLDEARRDDPALEELLRELPDPLFVKNLENVQGDERDVMFFSIGYAADAAGRLPMNFGPLNRVGGQRRLNVAVTRARERLVVYSTLLPEQIDLSRTSADGVRDLKAFLAYARDGQGALDSFATTHAGAQHESPFEAQVAARLHAAGFATHAQVGVAGYRIDLAVVDPKRPGAYLLAVECDGAQYHSAASARDRDRLRQAVLERMGWSVHRIWSTDWWYDPERQMRRLLDRIAAITAAHAASGEAGAPPPPPTIASAASLPPEREASADPVPAWPPEASPWPGLPAVHGGQRDFHDPAVQRALVSQIDVVCARCAPLSLRMLAEHLARAWDVKVVNRRVVERVAGLVPASGTWRLLGEEIWPAAGSPTQWPAFRYAADAADRDFDEVPLGERANALVWIVTRSVVLSDGDAARELARTFGVARLGAGVRRTAQEAIDAAVNAGRLVRDGDRLRKAG